MNKDKGYIGPNSIKIYALTDEQYDFMENGGVPLPKTKADIQCGFFVRNNKHCISEDGTYCIVCKKVLQSKVLIEPL